MYRTEKVVIILVTFLFFSTMSCGGRKQVKIDGKVPPTFEFSGIGSLQYVDVGILRKDSDKSSENNDESSKGILWKLRTDSYVFTMPRFKYGDVPKNFTQVFPAQGKPVELQEGKLYYIWAPVAEETGWVTHFIIKDGKSIELSASQVSDYFQNNSLKGK